MFQIDDEGNSYKYDHLSRHSNNNKNAVLQHFIEHRRALENKATERQQLQAAKKYLRKSMIAFVYRERRILCHFVESQPEQTGGKKAAVDGGTRI